ncbi:hypothetical protein AAWM_09365 [Aspergillus awamori]|uniref:Dolichyl-diphosphooligosaccharide-protein glycosyltransferase subunit OST5 n=1 Tax=Aspergillus awamori TaxID=105351 RepID=A0A401L4S8_ASPAW|nr:hypothetical protein AAWM_09365 [Aspergillus awamori]GJP95030.1 hypothetical protein AlacWU_07929 [Aspergillus niger]GKZ94942.1 ssDNA endodeoxyribonuclease [Aspergillus niger]GLA39237.1 ssDNA endodeoxyribonuclease [Aspergillus niger]
MSLNEVWQAASASPYTPPVSKDNQFLVGFSLLLAAFILTGLFGLSQYTAPEIFSTSEMSRTMITNAYLQLEQIVPSSASLPSESRHLWRLASEPYS